MTVTVWRKTLVSARGRAQRLLFIATLVLVLPGTGAAATLTFVAPGAGDMQDLDHHYVYTWRISGLTSGQAPLIPANEVITSAVLHFENIRTSQNSANRLFMHLLDTAKTSGTGLTVVAGSTSTNALYRATDVAGSSTSNLPIRDDLGRDPDGAPGYYSTAGGRLLSGTTSNTPIGNAFATTTYSNGSGNPTSTQAEGWARGSTGTATQSFSTTPEDYEFSFGAGPFLTALNAYVLANGDFAIGLDPDCLCFNDGIWLTLTTGQPLGITAAVPEPVSLVLFGSGLAGLYVRRRRQRRAEASL